MQLTCSYLKYFRFLLASLLLHACVPISQQVQTGTGTTPTGNAPYYADKKLTTTDTTYEASIQTVILHPKVSADDPVAAAYLQPAIIPFAQSQPLVLEFDELSDRAGNFRAKIYHCNANWTVSLLNDIEFLEEYNDFLLTQYQYSAATKVPYVHYSFDVPRVKLSGNFVLMVYREGNVKDLMLTRRFMVYQNTISISPLVRGSTSVQERSRNQQVEFSLSYQNYPITNPRETVKVVVRQNFRWDNAIINLLPTSIKEDVALLEYQPFNLENNFPGLNEFRVFDMRSLRFLGMNLDKINTASDSTDVYLLPDKPRAREPYVQSVDYNGLFVVDNYETGRGATEADYADVHFTLRSPEPFNGDVHLWGAFMNYQPTQQTRLTYDPANQVYKGTYRLKQGYYNYMYALQPGGKGPISATYIEGSYFEAENYYEILVYHRPLGTRNDLLVGYSFIRHNARN